MLSSRIFLAAVFCGIGFSSVADSQDERFTSEDKSAADIFDERIMPIFRSKDPSSCVQCHLSSVDLKNYILPSHEKTFLSLRDQGLIDLESPSESKILELISMGKKDADEGAVLIHQKMRQAEYKAFASWIKACCDDDKLTAMPKLKSSEFAKPEAPNEVIRHARKSRIVNSFARNIWSQRMRCFPCHTPHEIKPNQKGAREKYETWESQFGDRMPIFKETPRETLDYLIELSEQRKKGAGIPMLDLDTPEKSLLVLKPTSKIPPLDNDGKRKPTYREPIYHMGGLKMHGDDHSYKMFISWIQDYANVTEGNYKTVDDLPADNWFPTQRVLRMRNVPDSWKAGDPVQLFVFAKDSKTGKWNTKPAGFTQGTITPRKIVNGPVILFAPDDEKKFKAWRATRNKLPRGEYLVKVYLDNKGIIEKDKTAILDASCYQGEIEIENALWRAGFPKATWISGNDLKKSEPPSGDGKK